MKTWTWIFFSLLLLRLTNIKSNGLRTMIWSVLSSIHWERKKNIQTLFVDPSNVVTFAVDFITKAKHWQCTFEVSQLEWVLIVRSTAEMKKKNLSSLWFTLLFPGIFKWVILKKECQLIYNCRAERLLHSLKVSWNFPIRWTLNIYHCTKRQKEVSDRICIYEEKKRHQINHLYFPINRGRVRWYAKKCSRIISTVHSRTWRSCTRCRRSIS